jgi:nucleoid DNA-binding protein
MRGHNESNMPQGRYRRQSTFDMNKKTLARRLARATNTSDIEAADYLDQVVLSILKQWKHGQFTAWPGLGVFSREPLHTPVSKAAKSEAH